MATVNKVTSSSRELTKRNTADFGDGLEGEELDQEAIEKEYNMRASKIYEKFEQTGDRKMPTVAVDPLEDSIASVGLNDRDDDDESRYGATIN